MEKTRWVRVGTLFDTRWDNWCLQKRFTLKEYYVTEWNPSNTLHWRHNDHDSVSNHQPHGCLLNRLFRRRSKKTSKLCVTGLCAGNSPGPVNSPHKGPVTRKMFPFDDVIMIFLVLHIARVTSFCQRTSVIQWQERGRLLHSPSLVTLRLSVESESLPPIAWCHPFVTGWSKYRLGWPQSQCIVGSRDRRGFPLCFRRRWQPPCTSQWQTNSCRWDC